MLRNGLLFDFVCIWAILNTIAQLNDYVMDSSLLQLMKKLLMLQYMKRSYDSRFCPLMVICVKCLVIIFFWGKYLTNEISLYD